MEQLLETMPIILLGIGQIMLATVYMNQEREIRRIKNKAIEMLTILFITRTELNLPIIPEILKDEEEAEHGQEEQ